MKRLCLGSDGVDNDHVIWPYNTNIPAPDWLFRVTIYSDTEDIPGSMTPYIPPLSDTELLSRVGDVAAALGSETTNVLYTRLEEMNTLVKCGSDDDCVQYFTALKCQLGELITKPC